MKLLFFSTYYHPYISGLTTYPRFLFRSLSKNHQITVLTFKHLKTLPTRELIDGVTVIRMPYLFKLSKGFISPQSLFYFFKLTFQNDRIFLNLPNFEGLPLALIAFMLHKSILSIYHCQVYLGRSFKAVIINSFLNLSVRFQLYCSRQIVAYTKDYVLSQPALKPFLTKIHYLLPPISILTPSSDFFHHLQQLKGNTKWIGFCGRLAREKGLEYLIQAISHLPQKNHYQLIISGPSDNEVVGEEEYFYRIKQLLSQSKINYQLMGSLEGEKLASFYRAIDILVLPSINQTEAFGMVQVEAMLQGTPVIATDLPGVRQPIKLSGMGEIVPPKDSLALSRAISRLFNNLEHYTHPSLQNQVKTIFDSSLTFNAYEKLLSV